jgi:hypothetical protein
MGSVRKTVLRLVQAIRDGAPTSSVVERFDTISTLLWIDHERSPGQVRFPASTVRDHGKNLFRRRRELWPLPDERIPLDDVTLERCMDIIESLDSDGASGDLPGRVFEEVLHGTFEKGDNQQFFTPRPVVDFMVGLVGERLRGRICDPACGTGGFLIGALMATEARDLEIVGWDVDPRLARAASLNLHLHGVVHHCVTALAAAGSLGDAVVPEFGSFDVVITNPPFGSDLTDRRALRALGLGRGKKRRRRGVLFVERCLELTRPGGIVCIVIDDSITAGRSNADVRELICRTADVMAVVSLPEASFMPYASVRTSILLLEKHSDGKAPRKSTFFARVGLVGRRPSGDKLLRVDPVTGAMELDSDLPIVLDAFHGRTTTSADRSCSAEWFECEPPSMAREEFVAAGLRLDIESHHPTRDRAIRELRSTGHELKTLSELVDVRGETVDPLRDAEGCGFTYVGLADIEPHTGAFEPRMVAVGSVRGPLSRFQSGDILFARLRPELRKICLVGDGIVGGLASSECLVLVPRVGADGRYLLDPRLMAALLRTDLASGQIMHLVTGIGRPRLSQRAVLAMRLPVPPHDVQQFALERWLSSRRQEAQLIDQSHEALSRAMDTARKAAADLVEDLVGNR